MEMWLPYEEARVATWEFEEARKAYVSSKKKSAKTHKNLVMDVNPTPIQCHSGGFFLGRKTGKNRCARCSKRRRRFVFFAAMKQKSCFAKMWPYFRVKNG